MSKTMCVLPWMHLATHPNGGASLCCRSNHTDAVSWAKKTGTNSIVTLDNDTIDDIMNSNAFIKVRQDMIDGRRPIECEGCWQDEDKGLKSKRQYENERWAHIIPKLEQTAKLSDINLIYVELRLGNVCNNACLTCNSYSSTKWYPDEKKIANDLPWFKLRAMENFKWFENEDFYWDLANKSQEVEEIYINGGEPTMVEKHFVYLEKLIERGLHKQINLWYNINLSQLPPKLIELWKQFKSVNISVSIDDLRERNSYIRNGSDWDTVYNNLLELKKMDWLDLSIVQTISTYSVLYLPEFYQHFYRDLGIHIHLNWCYDPSYLSPWTLPEEVKQKVIEDCSKVMQPWDLNNVQQTLSKPSNPSEVEKFKEYTAWLDSSRKENFAETFPELYSIL